MQIIKWGKVLAVSAALSMFAVPASAQEDEDGPMTQGDDAHYISSTLVKFKPGKRERAFEIIAEHFMPAGEKAGTPGPLGVIHYQTGEWDALFVWDLEGGMADLEWYRSPNNIKWYAALAEQEGSREAAGELMAEYRSLIDEAETDVGHYHADEEDSGE
ncbi:MAG: hypothetical protein OEU59_03180 [Gammaproteobacteria bacterium]|jgi:hypothetical protein|nr:hypothetical protein [Gammaproteobacteria bacterium]